MVATLAAAISPNFTESILIDMLNKKTGCEDITIKVIKTGKGTKKGDSYLSTTTKFTIEATGFKNNIKEEIFLPVIVKSIPKNVARRKTFRSVDFFETEINFYENVWPLMKKLKDSKNIDEVYEVPLVLLSCFDCENGYIAMEDISYQGYGTIARDKGISYEYASLFLKLLANFHALSVAAKDQDPNFEKVASTLKETYFDERFRKWYLGFHLNKLYPLVRNAVSMELDSTYLEKLDRLFTNDFYGLLCSLTHIHNKLTVVTQSDAWLPNFLVKHEQGKPNNAVLIDFQLARYSTLSNDLVNLLYSCISENVLVSKWDDLVEEYHKYLSQRISELGSDKNLITLNEIKEDIQKHSLIGIAMGLENGVMSMLNDEDVPDLDMIQGDEEVPLETVWDISPFKDELRNKKIAFLIKHAVDRGFIS